jgi:HAD superfamily hydrolase (TIGR01509 family)
MTYSLILFDCDGTLVDSEYLNNLAVLETLEHFGVRKYDMNYALTHFVGLRFSRILSNVTQDTGATFPPNAAKHYLQKVRDLAPHDMKPIAGAQDVVACAQKLARIGVVSNGERNNVLMSLDFTDLRKYFPDDDIFTGLMAEPKPAPDLYLLAAKTMGFAPSETLVIEDSITGVTAGVAAGMTVWGFCGTHHDQDNHIQTLKSRGAQKVFKTMKELQHHLNLTFLQLV